MCPKRTDLFMQGIKHNESKYFIGIDQVEQ